MYAVWNAAKNTVAQHFATAFYNLFSPWPNGIILEHAQNGWFIQARCPGNPVTHGFFGSSQETAGCVGNVTLNQSLLGTIIDAGATWRCCYLSNANFVPPFYQGKLAVALRIADTGVVPKTPAPWVNTWYPDVIAPFTPRAPWAIQVWPGLKPVLTPVYTPTHTPWRFIPKLRPDPRLPPSVQRAAGYGVAQVLEPSVAPLVAPALQFIPGKPPTRIGLKHKLRKPKKGDKERKFLLTGKGGIIKWAINAVTESGDFIDALYDALPKELTRQHKRDIRMRDYGDNQNSFEYVNGRKIKTAGVLPRTVVGIGIRNQPAGEVRRGPSPWDKAKFVYQNLDKVDVPKAFGNLVQNEVEDRAIGKASKARQKASRKAYDRGYLPRAHLELGPAL